MYPEAIKKLTWTTEILSKGNGDSVKKCFSFRENSCSGNFLNFMPIQVVVIQCPNRTWIRDWLIVLSQKIQNIRNLDFHCSTIS